MPRRVAGRQLQSRAWAGSAGSGRAPAAGTLLITQLGHHTRKPRLRRRRSSHQLSVAQKTPSVSGSVRRGHAVERLEHHRHQLLRGARPRPARSRRPGRSSTAPRRARPACVHDRQAGAGAAEELVQQRALVADRRRLEALPLGHRPVGLEHHHGRLRRVDLLRAPLAGSRRRRRAGASGRPPASRRTPGTASGRRARRRPPPPGRARAWGRRASSAGAACAPMPRPWWLGSDHELGELLHLAELPAPGRSRPARPSSSQIQ